MTPALAAAAGAILAWSFLRAPLPPMPTATDVAGVVKLSRPALEAGSVHEVRVRFSEIGEWPLAAGVILRLEKEGFRVTVDENATSLFGDQFEPTAREHADLWLSPPDKPAPEGGGLHRIGTVGKAGVWIRPAEVR